MKTKPPVEQMNDDASDNSSAVHHPSTSRKNRIYSPSIILYAMIGAVLLMDAVLPLRGLWFREALLTQLGPWPVLPTLILFPGQPVIPPVSFMHSSGLPSIPLSWFEIAVMVFAFLVVFRVYLLALRRLPGLISRRYILRSTLLLGILYALIPIVTSPDLYSYIAYARMGVIYHLNPLTTLPTAIRSDPIYHYVVWTDQPSAYGPTWAIISSILQWSINIFTTHSILPMLLSLRLLGLASHLGSTMLIWSISGLLQRLSGTISQEKRVVATLAFAWNPLLLLEACVNAHNDSTVLFFILLAIWVLVRNIDVENNATHLQKPGPTIRSTVLVAALLAIATCIKINIILLFPGLLLFLWMRNESSLRKIQHLCTVSAIYIATIILLYAPFWQGTAIFRVFQVNPGAHRNINTLADFLSHLYNSIAALAGYPLAPPIGSPSEHFTHNLSIGIFVLLYVLLCWQALRSPARMRTIPGLIRWLAVVWLLYCALGAPWFWPWYLVTFFGLYALIEAAPQPQSSLTVQAQRSALTNNATTKVAPTMSRKGKKPPNVGAGEERRRGGDPWVAHLAHTLPALVRSIIHRYNIRMLTFSMLTLYCFFAWAPQHSFIPALPGFEWAYLCGLWVWILPLIAGYIDPHRNIRQRYHAPQEELSDQDSYALKIDD